MCKVDSIPGLEIRKDMIGLRRWYYKEQRILIDWRMLAPDNQNYTARLMNGGPHVGTGPSEQDACEMLIARLEAISKQAAR